MPAKIFDLIGKRIHVAGHHGMVGCAIVRRLGACGCDAIIARRDEVDLERQEQAEQFLTATRPDVVIRRSQGKPYSCQQCLSRRVHFRNLAIARNAVHGRYQAGVKKLSFLAGVAVRDFGWDANASRMATVHFWLAGKADRPDWDIATPRCELFVDLGTT